MTIDFIISEYLCFLQRKKLPFSSRSDALLAWKQLIRYTVVGAGANLLGYGAYVALTFLKVGPLSAMSIVYTTACLASFLGNKNWTFRIKNSTKRLLPRYLAIQFIGYLTNLAMLAILSRVLGYPHQWIQLLAIFVVAVELFVLSKYCVFRVTKNGMRT